MVAALYGLPTLQNECRSGRAGLLKSGALTPRLTQAGQAWQQSWPRSVFTLSCARPRAPISTESPSGTFADRIGLGAASPQLHSCEAECIDGYAGASRVQRSSRQLVGRAFSVGNLRISSLAFFLFFRNAAQPGIRGSVYFAVEHSAA